MKNALWLLILCVSFPLAAFGQAVHPECPEPLTGEIGAKELASAWFNRAMELAERSKYDEAYAAYACSYRFVEHPNTLFNMGQAALESGNDPLALESFEKYTAANPDGKYAEEARTRIAEIRDRQALAQKAIDEQRAAAQRSEEDSVRGQVVSENEPEPTGQAAKPAKPTQRYELLSQGMHIKSILGWSAVAVGGAALGLGIGFEVGAHASVDNAEEARKLTEFNDYNEKAENYQTAATSFLIGAGVAATAGTLLLLLDRKDASDRIAVALHPQGLYLIGGF